MDDSTITEVRYVDTTSLPFLGKFVSELLAEGWRLHGPVQSVAVAVPGRLETATRVVQTLVR